MLRRMSLQPGNPEEDLATRKRKPMYHATGLCAGRPTGRFSSSAKSRVRQPFAGIRPTYISRCFSKASYVRFCKSRIDPEPDLLMEPLRYKEQKSQIRPANCHPKSPHPVDASVGAFVLLTRRPIRGRYPPQSGTPLPADHGKFAPERVSVAPGAGNLHADGAE